MGTKKSPKRNVHIRLSILFRRNPSLFGNYSGAVHCNGICSQSVINHFYSLFSCHFQRVCCFSLSVVGLIATTRCERYGYDSCCHQN